VRSTVRLLPQQFAQVTNLPAQLARIDRVSLQDADRTVNATSSSRSPRARQIGSVDDPHRGSWPDPWQLDEVKHAFLDLQYEPAEGLRPGDRAPVRQAERAVREGKLVLLMSDSLHGQGRIPAHALW